MAINFEAANMAGYNNPKMEVFKTVLNPETSVLVSYPKKSVIVGCLNRGSVPFLILTTPEGGLAQLLTLYNCADVEGEYTISFSSASRALGDHVITYPPDPDGVPQYQSIM